MVSLLLNAHGASMNCWNFSTWQHIVIEKMAGFSKGMKQKVALARALIHEPAILFLDEPTSGLDPLAARAVRELIVGLKRSNRSIILCTHDLDEAERLADQVAIIRQGRIVALDTPSALRKQATGETLVMIEFADECPLPLETLATIDGVHNPHFREKKASGSLSSATQPGALLLEYHTPRPKVVNPQVLSRLIALGAQVISVTCETSSLEDVYASAMNGANEEQTSAATTPNERMAPSVVHLAHTRPGNEAFERETRYIGSLRCTTRQVERRGKVRSCILKHNTLQHIRYI